MRDVNGNPLHDIRNPLAKVQVDFAFGGDLQRLMQTIVRSNGSGGNITYWFTGHEQLDSVKVVHMHARKRQRGNHYHPLLETPEANLVGRCDSRCTLTPDAPRPTSACEDARPPSRRSA